MPHINEVFSADIVDRDELRDGDVIIVSFGRRVRLSERSVNEALDQISFRYTPLTSRDHTFVDGAFFVPGTTVMRVRPEALPA